MRCGARESRTCLGSGEWARRGDVRLEGCYSFTSCPKAATFKVQSLTSESSIFCREARKKPGDVRRKLDLMIAAENTNFTCCEPLREDARPCAPAGSTRGRDRRRKDGQGR